MAGIQTSISITDNMSSTLYGMVDALNTTLSTLENLHSAVQRDTNINMIDAVRAGLNTATAAAERFGQELDQLRASAPIVAPTWQSPQNLEYFGGNDMARYRQEIQSANTMLTGLVETQQLIRQQASTIHLIPEQATTDLAAMETRIRSISAQIDQMQNERIQVVGIQQANADMESLRQRLSQALQAQERLNAAVNNMDVSAANAAYNRLNATINQTEREIRDNIEEQRLFNAEVARGGAAANVLRGKIGAIAGAYLSIQTLGKVISLSDQMTSTDARLNLIKDEGSTVETLQNKIFSSAQRSRGNYLDTADSVAKLSLLSGDTFKSNDETIAFTEQLNKMFTIAGTETAGRQAAMRQLTQAMAVGKLQGDEMVTVKENAPILAKEIEKQMLAAGAKGNMKDWSSKGMITADVIKNAMFAATEETNARFASMPQTFAQAMDSMKNRALMAFRPVFAQLTELANSQAFQQFADAAIQAVAALTRVLLVVFYLASIVGSAIAEAWWLIGPPIFVAVSALLAYKAALITINTIQRIKNTIDLISAAITAVKNRLTREAAEEYIMQATSCSAATAAQWALNAAILANPITWIIGLILLFIGVIYLAVGAMNKFAGTSIGATGVIMGAFAVSAAFLYNSFIVPIQNGFAILGNFLINVFKNPVAAIEMLFINMAQAIIGQILTVANGIEALINMIPGANMDVTSRLQGVYDGLAGREEKIKAESGWTEYIGRLEYQDYGAAANAGYQMGQKIDGSFAYKDPYVESSYIPEIAANTADMRDQMGASVENLKYFRDIAERDAVNRYTTAEVKVDLGGVNNNVSSNTDLDGLVNYLSDNLRQVSETTAAGVYA